MTYVTHADKVAASRVRLAALSTSRKRAHAAVAHLHRSGRLSDYAKHTHKMRIETAYSLKLCEILAE